MKTLYGMILKTFLDTQCLKQIGPQMLYCFVKQRVREVRTVLQLARSKVTAVNY